MSSGWIFIVAGVILGAIGSLSIYHGQAVLRQRESALSRYAGVLQPNEQRRITLLFSTHKQSDSQLEIGDSGAIFSWLGPQGKPLFKLFTDSDLIVESIDGQVAVSTRLFSRKGSMVVELIRNESKVAPPPQTWDRNYSPDALEVKDDTGGIVLQVRVLSDRVRVQGKWYDGHGHTFVMIKSPDPKLPGGIASMVDQVTLQKLRITPLFKYPSALHLGERV